MARVKTLHEQELELERKLERIRERIKNSLSYYTPVFIADPISGCYGAKNLYGIIVPEKLIINEEIHGLEKGKDRVLVRLVDGRLWRVKGNLEKVEDSLFMNLLRDEARIKGFRKGVIFKGLGNDDVRYTAEFEPYNDGVFWNYKGTTFVDNRTRFNMSLCSTGGVIYRPDDGWTVLLKKNAPVGKLEHIKFLSDYFKSCNIHDKFSLRHAKAFVDQYEF